MRNVSRETFLILLEAEAAVDLPDNASGDVTVGIAGTLGAIKDEH